MVGVEDACHEEKSGGEKGVPNATFLHGGAYVRGDRAYLPYSAGGFVVLDISDKLKPRMISDLPFSPQHNIQQP